MATRVSYPVEIKMKAIEMRLAEVPVKVVMEELKIKTYSQLEYCGMKKPLVRSFEPRVAENHASECIEESHQIKFYRWLWLSLFI